MSSRTFTQSQVLELFSQPHCPGNEAEVAWEWGHGVSRDALMYTNDIFEEILVAKSASPSGYHIETGNFTTRMSVERKSTISSLPSYVFWLCMHKYL